MKAETIQYRHYGECVRLTGDFYELVIMVERGPRVIRFSCLGGENVFAELKSEGFETENGYWYMHGGHRLWHSPEISPRTYTLDLEPVEWKMRKKGIHVVQKPNEHDALQKEMDIRFEGDQVSIVHSIVNKSPWAAEFSVWALSAMATGGTLIAPQNTSVTGLLANRNLVLWPYTDITDNRAKIGNNYILVKNTKGKSPFMFGQSNEFGYAAYAVKGDLFIKKFGYDPEARYPDMGCNFESYCCDFMSEVESLSPLKTTEPGEAHTHTEYWKLVSGIKAPSNEAEAAQIMEKVGL